MDVPVGSESLLTKSYPPSTKSIFEYAVDDLEGDPASRTATTLLLRALPTALTASGVFIAK